MKTLAYVLYHHKFGTDVIPFTLDEKAKLPCATNELLKELGVDNPELGECNEEWAEVGTFSPLEYWRSI
jgi:outer membrane usher protein FimD/PapC